MRPLGSHAGDGELLFPFRSFWDPHRPSWGCAEDRFADIVEDHISEEHPVIPAVANAHDSACDGFIICKWPAK